MSSRPIIQNIDPTSVVHELISKPYGYYIIRASTENDDILSHIKFNSQKNTHPYVILSVRVNERSYPSPIMNYRLPLIESNSKESSINLLEYYKQCENKCEFGKLPKLKEECIVSEENINWEIEPCHFQNAYRLMYSSKDTSDIEGSTICKFENVNNEVKVFNKTFLNDEQNFQHEFSLLKNLSYFHIVSFYGICSESEQIKHLVFANNGESLKKKYPTIKYSNQLMIKQLSMIGYQIACGMIYLEYKNIIHRDLHAGNILIDEYNFIRISDFGHAIIKDDDNEKYQESIKNSKTHFRTRRLAPECLPSFSESGNLLDSNETLLAKFSSKSDVWAYALIFIELMIGENEDVYPNLPVKSTDTEVEQFIHHIKLEGKRHEQPDDCPENFYNVLIRCWNYYPEDRISFVDLRNEMMILFKSKDNWKEEII